MNKKKVTKKELLEMIKGVVVDSEVENTTQLVEFIEKEQKALERKKTAAQKENEVLVEVVYEALKEVEKAVTVAEFLKNDKIAEAGIKSSQKLSALLKKLYDAHRINKYIDKRKSYFSSIPEIEE